MTAHARLLQLLALLVRQGKVSADSANRALGVLEASYANVRMLEDMAAKAGNYELWLAALIRAH